MRAGSDCEVLTGFTLRRPFPKELQGYRQNDLQAALSCLRPLVQQSL